MWMLSEVGSTRQLLMPAHGVRMKSRFAITNADAHRARPAGCDEVAGWCGVVMGGGLRRLVVVGGGW